MLSICLCSCLIQHLPVESARSAGEILWLQLLTPLAGVLACSIVESMACISLFGFYRPTLHLVQSNVVHLVCLGDKFRLSVMLRKLSLTPIVGSVPPLYANIVSRVLLLLCVLKYKKLMPVGTATLTPSLHFHALHTFSSLMFYIYTLQKSLSEILSWMMTKVRSTCCKLFRLVFYV